jgi:hypothetical protein
MFKRSILKCEDRPKQKNVKRMDKLGIYEKTGQDEGENDS